MEPFCVLPLEIVKHIVEFLDYPMGEEEAKQHRDKSMIDQKFFVEESTRGYFERAVSIW